MERDQETLEEGRSLDPSPGELAQGLAGFARWFASSRDMHAAAEQAAYRGAPPWPE